MTAFFSMLGFHASDPVRNDWSMTGNDEITVTVDEARTHFDVQGEKPKYIVNNAWSKHFRSVTEGFGVPVTPADMLVLSAALTRTGNLRAGLKLLEYDARGNRLGEVTAPEQGVSGYVPSEGTARVVFALRLVGEGRLTIESLGLALRKGAAVGKSPGLIPLADGLVSNDPQAAFDELRHSLTELEASTRRIREQLPEAIHPTADDAAESKPGTPSAGLESSRQMIQELLVSMARDLPGSNGSHYFGAPFPYRVAVISDEYMLNFYRDTFRHTIYVHPSQVEQVIDEGFDVLLYVTCWKGLQNEEWRGLKFRPRPAEALDRLLEHCADHSIPTLFQSIEDPSNFEYFLPVAQRFDYVFTSDTDCLDSYRAELGHDRVHYAEYGANPLLNNPIGNERHTVNRAFFGGSYPQRYADRCQDMETMFDSILETGHHLQIADRNLGNDELAFPERFRGHCMPPVPHDVLQRIHKLFRYSLNFNSIKASPTMCAMRIYELQAQGRGILSNYARSVFNRFPEIRLVAEPEDLSSYFASPVSHEERKLNEQMVRNVLTDRTSFDIVDQMLRDAGLEPGEVTRLPEVLVVANLADTRIKKSIDRQQYPNIIAVDHDDTARALESLAEGAENSRYIAVLGPDIDYGEHYLTDRVNAFKYVDVDVVTQSSTIGPDGTLQGTWHDFVSGPVDPELSLFAADRVPISRIISGEVTKDDLVGYAVPPYQTISVERDAASAAPDPVLSIIVPVYDNGRFLETKCLASIQRNLRWQEFEIILVDDGSTDGVTPGICRHLAEVHPNVRFHSFADGGSGSASRPRNRGLEMATAPLIAYLDPDNEISDGGYDILLEIHHEVSQKHERVDFISGYQVKVGGKTSMTGRHSRSRTSVCTDLRGRFFDSGRFPVVSTQAAVISRELLVGSEIRFVEGGAGQDTLFGWELLLNASTGVFTNATHLLYYAERGGSITNAVSGSYFRKAKVLEDEQAKVLARFDLLGTFVEHHLGNFVRGWYLKKLASVPPDEREESFALLCQIIRLYGVAPETLVPKTAAEATDQGEH